MDLYTLGTSFEKVAIVENFSSLVWTERHSSYGDFELVVEATNYNQTNLRKGTYLLRDPPPAGSRALMVVENIQIDNEKITNGSKKSGVMKVSGRSIESFFDRRVIVPSYDPVEPPAIPGTPTAELLDARKDARSVMDDFVYKAAIVPYLNEDIIPQLRLATNVILDAPFINAKSTVDGSLYDCIKVVADLTDLGFFLRFSYQDYTVNSNYNLDFTVRKGVNRTSNQTAVPNVIFKSSFDNLIDTTSLVSDQEYYNYAQVYGADWTVRQDVVAPGVPADISGLDRRVLIVDGNNVKRPTSGQAFRNRLKQRGLEELAKKRPLFAFDGTIDPGGLFKFGSDYQLGDYVDIADSNGNTTVSKVSEYIWYVGTDGISEYPTFQSIPNI